MTTEPTPLRDNGPFATPDQARAQLAATTHGIPPGSVEPHDLAAMPIREALMLTRVELTDFERAQVAALGRVLDPEACQVIAGWVLRSYLNSPQRSRN
ncbi:hypothetical protein [Micromonospora sp. DH14]|uniref:hypothetical protein n=1 Tax=unclassified Micromonospora TaxID=2617518 RepID=UPI002441E379|nr:hypothetical protein [Micromonospora sp. DH14]MDG9679028.1 hypothetical protein [Micromonospora sp. DH14]